jgi:mono/diheme cytochrome c family protein
MNAVMQRVVVRSGFLAIAASVFAVAVLAQNPAAEEDPAGMLGTTSGEAVYQQICQGCHMSEGRGAQGAGSYPAFAGNPAVASANYMAVTILNGRRNMPAFARPQRNDNFFGPTWLSDEQIANVINYIRTGFGNDYRDPISAADVRALRPQPETPAAE